MSISIGGLVSGLDTESMVKQLMDLERRPIFLLQAKEAGYQSKISALGSLKGVLSTFQSAAASLGDASGYVSFKATSDNTNVLTVSAGDEAIAGKYQVEITSLATAQQVRSASFIGADEVVGTGTLTIQVGSGTAFDVAIDAEHQTLAGIAQAINAAETDVSAAVVDDGAGNVYLTLASSETGVANTISLTMADDDLDNSNNAGLSALHYIDDVTPPGLIETQAASNAQLTVNGIAVERAGNSIDDLIAGVTLTLKDADPGNPFEVNVVQNFSTITSKAENFVKQYNAMVDAFDSLQKYDPETKSAGALIGDSTTRQLRSRLQSMLYEQVNGVADEVNGLSRLGLAVDRYGKLSLDSERLTTAIEENSAEVISFFTNDEVGNEGIALRFDNLLGDYLKSTTGLLATKEEGLQSSIKDIGKQVERIEFRLLKREENLRQQFLSLEGLLANLQATQGALDQQLQSLANLAASIYGKK